MKPHTHLVFTARGQLWGTTKEKIGFTSTFRKALNSNRKNGKIRIGQHVAYKVYAGRKNALVIRL